MSKNHKAQNHDQPKRDEGLAWTDQRSTGYQSSKGKKRTALHTISDGKGDTIKNKPFIEHEEIKNLDQQQSQWLSNVQSSRGELTLVGR